MVTAATVDLEALPLHAAQDVARTLADAGNAVAAGIWWIRVTCGSAHLHDLDFADSACMTCGIACIQAKVTACTLYY